MVTIREATGDEFAAVMGVVDAGLLAIDAGEVRDHVESDREDGTVLVAVEGGRVLGALVLDRGEIEAIAVRPGRRGQGIGSALVREAGERVEGPLIARFHERLREFYEGLGFEIESIGGERYRGRR